MSADDWVVKVSVGKARDWQHDALVIVMVFCVSPVSVFTELRGVWNDLLMAWKIPVNEPEILS